MLFIPVYISTLLVTTFAEHMMYYAVCYLHDSEDLVWATYKRLLASYFVMVTVCLLWVQP